MKRCSQTLLIDSDDIMAEIATWCDSGHDVLITPKGMSMYPFVVGNRDSVVLRHTDIVRKGDMVAARIPEKGCVLHRVYAVSDECLVLMGDSNLYATEICSPKNVLAIVTKILRNGQQVNTDSKKERFAVKVWMFLLPLRGYLLWLLRKLQYRL